MADIPFETISTEETEFDESYKVASSNRRKNKIKSIRGASQKKKGGKHYSQYISVSGFVSLSADLRDLFLSEEDSDVIIKVEDKEYRAHVNILRSRSPVFNAMLKHDMLEKNRGVVQIPDCNPYFFRDFLLYLYTGKIDDISQSNVFDLYDICDKFNVKGLKNDCVKFLTQNMSIDIICDILVLSMKHIESELLRVATDFFIENADDILPIADWQRFVKANPVQANELFIKAYKNKLNRENADDHKDPRGSQEHQRVGERKAIKKNTPESSGGGVRLTHQEVPGSSREYDEPVEEICMNIPENAEQLQQVRDQARELLQSAGVSPRELQSILEGVRELVHVLPELTNIREQVRGILRDAEDYDASA